ncbi:MAG: hypothetical protein ABH846_03740 [Patescibacteria group bacterium]
MFWTPSSGSVLVYYFGPDFQLGQHYNLGAKLGFVGNWPAAGDAPPMLSIWQTVLIQEGRYSLFTETDLIPAGDGLHYIGVYSADINIELISIGVHGEQFDTAVTTGSHINFNLTERLSTGLQHHWLIGDTYQGLRLTLQIRL